MGEYADPDYFGRDTGDASKDEPLNADGIGENEILVVSFGTSFNDSRVKDIGGIEINSPADALPFITNISVTGRRSEPMLSFLSEKGVYVSSGSACSKGKKSRVLAEMGLDSARLESPLRISFSRFTTKEEIDLLALAIKQGIESIRPSK